MEEHRKICEKTKERKGLEGYEIIEEYEKLTNELLQKMQKMKEENAKEKKEIQIKSERYNNKITDKVNDLVSKNYHYSLILSVLKKKGVNVEEMCYKECVHKTNF